MLADDLEVPLEQQRFWTWAKRQNSTYRPNNILTPADDEKRVMDLKVHSTAEGGFTHQAVGLPAETCSLGLLWRMQACFSRLGSLDVTLFASRHNLTSAAESRGKKSFEIPA